MRRQLLVSSLLVSGLIASGQIVPTSPKLPFTLSKETTIITSPLRSNGIPDYVAALNEQFGKSVTPETNGFALWLTIIPQEELVSPSDRGAGNSVISEILKLAGAKPHDPSAPLFQTYTDWITKRNIRRNAQQVEITEFNLACSQLWSAADHPQVAEYLQSQSPALDITVKAAECSQWWIPSVRSADGIYGLVIPDISPLRQAASALAARATLRAKGSDFEGFLRDALAVKKLAHHLAGGSTIAERITGISIDKPADQALAAAIGSGTLTEAQCTAVATALAQFPTLPDLSTGFETERRNHLEFIMMLAIGNRQLLKNMGAEMSDPSIAEFFRAINSASVDWDAVLKHANDFHDQVAAAIKLPTLKESKASAVSIDATFNPSTVDWNHKPDLHKHPDETNAAYTQRVAAVFTVPGGAPASAFVSTNQSIYRARLFDQMLSALLTVATQKAQTRAWPTTLDFPQDLYPVANPAPIKFMFSSSGLQLHSVGPNGIDDHATGDDLCLGPPPPSSATNLP